MRAQQTRPNLRQARDTLIAHGVAHRLAQWGLGGLLALILVVAHAPGGWATIDLKEFTATTQEDGAILLRWITGTELDTSSFRIYRAETAAGPWDTVFIGPDSNSDGLTDTVYEYNDTDVTDGTTYFYLLEEVEVGGGVNRYVDLDFIPSATAGQPGAPTSTPTATLTATRTSTPGASPTPSRTPNQTPSRTPSPTATRANAATATNTPNDAPTPTVRPGTTPTSQGQTQPTAAVTAAATAGAPGAATATPLPAGRVATPTGQAGVNPLPTPSAAPRPGSTPPRPGAATATPPALPAPAATLNPQRTPTATPSPAVFASKPTEPPVLRGAAPRPTLATTQTEATPRGDGWILALGGVAVILAALLGGVALFLSRRHHS